MTNLPARWALARIGAGCTPWAVVRVAVDVVELLRIDQLDNGAGDDRRAHGLGWGGAIDGVEFVARHHLHVLLRLRCKGCGRLDWYRSRLLGGRLLGGLRPRRDRPVRRAFHVCGRAGLAMRLLGDAGTGGLLAHELHDVQRLGWCCRAAHAAVAGRSRRGVQTEAAGPYSARRSTR